MVDSTTLYTEGPDVYAGKLGIDIGDLHVKICAGINGVSISHFTDAELKFLKACLEVACEF